MSWCDNGSVGRGGRGATRRRGGRGWHWTDVVTFGWLAAGLVLIFGPALWLLLSSFKTPAQLAEGQRLLREERDARGIVLQQQAALQVSQP